MAQAASVQQAFQDIGTQFGWEAPVIAWATDAGGLGALSVNGFIYAARDAGEIGDFVKSIPGVTNAIQQASRLRQAWTALSHALQDQETLKRKRQDDADLEDWPDVECAPNNGQTFGEKENSQHESSFEHLLEEGERIYFFIDVPHLFKCVRNYIFNKKQLQVIKINQQML